MYSELQNLRQPERTFVVPWADVVLPEAVGQAVIPHFEQSPEVELSGADCQMAGFITSTDGR